MTVGRIHVGLMVPANNTTLEPELLKGLPAGATCTTVRIPRGKGLLTRQTLPDYTATALSLAARLAEPDINVVAYGCTAAGFIGGPEEDARLAAELARITSKPVVTTARSMVVALQEASARRIALITPYQDIVNDRLKEFLADGGITVARFDSFYAADVEELGRIRSEDVARLAAATMADDCDAMFIACAQLPSFDVVPALESEFGRPVLSSNRATTTQALRAAGAL